MKTPEKVLLEWTTDEIQFNGMVFTRDDITRLARAIQHGCSQEQIEEHKFAATYLNWEKVQKFREFHKSHIVPDVTPQFLAQFWSLDELLLHAQYQRPHKMPASDPELTF